METLKFIFKNLDNFKTRFFIIFLIGIGDGFATFLIPVTLAEFTKSPIAAINANRLIILIFSFYIASLVFQWIIRKFGESLGPQLGNYLRLKYFQALESLSIENLHSYHSGYILSLINKVADGLTPIIFDIFWTFAKSIASLGLFFFFTAKESLTIAIVNLIILAVFISLSTFLAKKIVPIADELNQKRASLLQYYTDFMSNILTVKKLGIYSFVQKKLAKKTEENYQQIQKLQNFHANRWLFLHSLFGLAFLSTIAFLIQQIFKGQISVSVLILFVAAYTIIKGHVERLSENFKVLMEMKAYIKTLDKIIYPNRKQYTGRSIKEWASIIFHDVDFKYKKTEKIIHIPKFSIRKGEKICIFGKSGEGKTTLLNLVADFIKPIQGQRSIDGENYDKLENNFFSAQMTVISQETELFNISLKENITLGQKIDEKKILDIFERLDLLTWLQNLDQGLDTIVGEKGVKLSAGQKQRINLIRGLLLNREIILLDEPTSHLDSITEKKVINFLNEYLNNKTAIIVSHSDELKKICNRSYIFKNHILSEI